MRHFLLQWQQRRALTWNLSKQLWDEQRHKALVYFLCCGFVSGCSFLTLLMYWFHRLLWQTLDLLGVWQNIYYYSVNFLLCFKGFDFGPLYYSVILPRMFPSLLSSAGQISACYSCVSFFESCFFSILPFLLGFFFFFFSFFCFCLRDVEELVHGIRGFLDFPVSCLVHCFAVPDLLYLWAEQYNPCY